MSEDAGEAGDAQTKDSGAEATADAKAEHADAPNKDAVAEADAISAEDGGEDAEADADDAAVDVEELQDGDGGDADVATCTPQPVDCTLPAGDYDCDGVIDTNCPCVPGASQSCYSGPAGTSGVGLCHGGSQDCLAVSQGSAWGPCTGEVTPSAELCEGADNDCDGQVDTGCECLVGATQACYSGPPGTSGVGICHGGLQTCQKLPVGSSWGACEGEGTPQPDQCDGVDYQCTGQPGATCVCIIGATRACYEGPPATRGVGLCVDGVQTCISSGSASDWGPCVGQKLPVPENCGNALDDDCSGTVNNGCAGTITCPGDGFVAAGQAIILKATGTNIASLTWQTVSAPGGGPPTWSPYPPDALIESFRPWGIGLYRIRVAALDLAGVDRTCEFDITAQKYGLRVELTWNGPGDLDLHLHRGTSTPWFTADDCYRLNKTPAWGAVLDFDNSTGYGPENIIVNSPVIGETYTIGVHNFEDGMGRTATVKIICGAPDSTIPTATFTGSTFDGTSTGNCSVNRFWKAARVVFTSGSTCTITPINTYSPSSAVCAAY